MFVVAADPRDLANFFDLLIKSVVVGRHRGLRSLTFALVAAAVFRFAFARPHLALVLDLLVSGVRNVAVDRQLRVTPRGHRPRFHHLQQAVFPLLVSRFFPRHPATVLPLGRLVDDGTAPS